MMMMIKKIAAIVPAALLTIAAASQDSDFGIWYSAGAKAGVTRKIDAEIAAELRTFRSAGKVEQGFIEAGVEYKFNDWISAEPSYRITSAIEDDSKHHLQHKLFLDLKSSFKAGVFTIQGRYRFQTRIRTYYEYVEDKYPDLTSRIRLKIILRTKAFPINPFVYAETFIPMNKKPEKLIGKNRFASGIEYKISKTHSLDLVYAFERDYLPSVSDMNIINIGYNFNF